MGHYIRILSTSSDCIALSMLQSNLEENDLMATLSVDEGASDDWTQLILSHPDGREIASIERNLVGDGSLGSDEMTDFANEVADLKPDSAVKWLLEFFPRVRCIYAFQLLGGTDHKNGREILGAVRNRVWSSAPSIIQAEDSPTKMATTSYGSSANLRAAIGG